MKKVVLNLAAVLFSLIITAQQKKETYNAIHWRISGNGLAKPSYLFGTIHITDKRVFHFTDSLYSSLEKTDGFAAELDLSSVFTQYLNELMTKEAEGEEDEEKEKTVPEKKYLTDSLDKALVDKYRSMLEKNLQKPVDKIRVKDLEKRKEDWMTEMLRTGEMKTFMDAYLFDIAQHQGKWVGGIEDPEDQFGVEEKMSLEEKIKQFSSNPRSEKKSLEWMINTYLKQDLDAIDRSDEIWQGSKDVILIQRNKKMANRIDSLSHIRSTLFAIGAAHIPGEEGVISLLRKKGFTVTPVYSDKKIAPEKYSYKKIDLPWTSVPINDSLYAVQVPGKAEAFSMLEGLPIDMKFYFDMGNMRAYFTMNFPLPEAPTAKNRDSLVSQLINRFTEKGNKPAQKDIIINGEKGKEFITSTSDAELRIQLFITQSFVAMNFISAFKKEGIYGEDAERFFRSFKINKNIAPPVAENSKSRWQKFSFEKHGFSVELPGKYRERKEKEENISWEETNIETLDLVGDAYYAVRVSQVKKGYYSDSDSAYFEEMIEGILENMKGTLLSKNHYSFDGYPACRMVSKAESEGDEIYMNVQFVNKGPRRYLLFITAQAKGEPEDAGKRFFESFSFLPMIQKEWKQVTAPDMSFTAWSPAGINKDEESEKEKNEIKYSIIDPQTHVQVYIDKDVIPAYYWTKSDSLLFRNRINTFYTFSDSLLYYRPVVNGKVKGIDLLIKLRNTHNLKKMRVLLNGDTLYSVYTYLPEEFLLHKNYIRLFDDFRITDEKKPVDFTIPKSRQLLQALQTSDSLSFEIAKAALDEATFLPADLPLLQQALLYTYQDFDSLYYYNTNTKIAQLIEKLDSQGTSIEFVRKNYPALNGKNEHLKPFMLGLLSGLKTTESYQLLKELILAYPPVLDEPYYFRNAFYDSLTLTRQLYPDLLKLAGNEGVYDFLNDLTVHLVDSGLVDATMLRVYKNDFIKTAGRLLSLPDEKKKDEFYRYSSLVRLLGKINLPETIELVRKFGAINERPLRLDVIMALAENGHTPDAKDIYTLATTDEFRSQLYDGLKKFNKENLFPKDYLNQRQLGQSEVYSYASEDDSPETIVYFGERVMSFMGKKQKFYLYKVYYIAGDGESCYLGVAGPYSMDPKDVSSTHDVTGLYYDEVFDAKKADQHLAELIRQAEEWLIENKKK